MHFAFNRYGVKSRMRMNYRVNDNPTSGHLDGLSSPPPPGREFSKFLKNKIRMPGVSLGGERGGGWMGTGGRTDWCIRMHALILLTLDLTCWILTVLTRHTRDFVVRGRPLRGQKRLSPLAKWSTCSKSIVNHHQASNIIVDQIE